MNEIEENATQQAHTDLIMKKYDVFISFKSEDSKLAMDLHRYLTENGLSVFFSDITLGNIGASEYSEIIDNALENSMHMIVIASKIYFLNSNWVRYEWSSFLNDLKCGYKKGNLITILSPDVHLSDLPVGLRHRQSFTTKSYKENILPYLTSELTVKNTQKKRKIRPLHILIFTAIACLAVGLSILAKLNIKVYPETIPEYTIDFSDSNMVSYITSKAGLKVDYEKVYDSFELARNGGSDAQFEIGSLCYDSKNYDDALYWFVLSAKQGDLRAANGIGRCYYNAYGVRRWPRNAFNWFRYSARGGCPDGINNLGKCYEEGFGVRNKNEKKAMKYYRAAADLAYVPAVYNIGSHYFFGEILEQDVEEGMKWLRNAAHQGSASAQFTLGNIYREGLGGFEIDYEEAEKWYTKVMENNNERLKEKTEKNLLLMKSEQK